MRPIYQSEQDKIAERRVQSYLMETWRCAVHELPDMYHTDLLAIHRKSTFIEVKHRTCLAADYPFFIIGAGKFMAGLNLAATFNDTTFAIILSFRDGELFLAWQEDVDRTLIWSGRKRDDAQRGDWQDMEPCIKLFPAKMQKIREAAPWPR